MCATQSRIGSGRALTRPDPQNSTTGSASHIIIMTSFKNKTNYINIACHTNQPANCNTAEQDKENSILKITLKEAIPSCVNLGSIFGVSVQFLDPLWWRQSSLEWRRSNDLFRNTLGILPLTWFGRYFCNIVCVCVCVRIEGSYLFLCLLGGPVVPP